MVDAYNYVYWVLLLLPRLLIITVLCLMQKKSFAYSICTFSIFSAKADQLQETKTKYNKQLKEMDQLHAQMKETEATLAEERDYIARTQQECKTVNIFI